MRIEDSFSAADIPAARRRDPPGRHASFLGPNVAKRQPRTKDAGRQASVFGTAALRPSSGPHRGHRTVFRRRLRSMTVVPPSRTQATVPQVSPGQPSQERTGTVPRSGIDFPTDPPTYGPILRKAGPPCPILAAREIGWNRRDRTRFMNDPAVRSLPARFPNEARHSPKVRSQTVFPLRNRVSKTFSVIASNRRRQTLQPELFVVENNAQEAKSRNDKNDIREKPR